MPGAIKNHDWQNQASLFGQRQIADIVKDDKKVVLKTIVRSAFEQLIFLISGGRYCKGTVKTYDLNSNALPVDDAISAIRKTIFTNSLIKNKEDVSNIVQRFQAWQPSLPKPSPEPILVSSPQAIIKEKPPQPFAPSERFKAMVKAEGMEAAFMRNLDLMDEAFQQLPENIRNELKNQLQETLLGDLSEVSFEELSFPQLARFIQSLSQENHEQWTSTQQNAAKEIILKGNEILHEHQNFQNEISEKNTFSMNVQRIVPTLVAKWKEILNLQTEDEFLKEIEKRCIQPGPLSAAEQHDLDMPALLDAAIFQGKDIADVTNAMDKFYKALNKLPSKMQIPIQQKIKEFYFTSSESSLTSQEKNQQLNDLFKNFQWDPQLKSLVEQELIPAYQNLDKAISNYSLSDSSKLSDAFSAILNQINGIAITSAKLMHLSSSFNPRKMRDNDSIKETMNYYSRIQEGFLEPANRVIEAVKDGETIDIAATTFSWVIQAENVLKEIKAREGSLGSFTYLEAALEKYKPSHLSPEEIMGIFTEDEQTKLSKLLEAIEIVRNFPRLKTNLNNSPAHQRIKLWLDQLFDLNAPLTKTLKLLKQIEKLDDANAVQIVVLMHELILAKIMHDETFLMKDAAFRDAMSDDTLLLVPFISAEQSDQPLSSLTTSTSQLLVRHPIGKYLYEQLKRREHLLPIDREYLFNPPTSFNPY